MNKYTTTLSCSRTGGALPQGARWILRTHEARSTVGGEPRSPNISSFRWTESGSHELPCEYKTRRLPEHPWDLVSERGTVVRDRISGATQYKTALVCSLDGVRLPRTSVRIQNSSTARTTVGPGLRPGNCCAGMNIECRPIQNRSILFAHRGCPPTGRSVDPYHTRGAKYCGRRTPLTEHVVCSLDGVRLPRVGAIFNAQVCR